MASAALQRTATGEIPVETHLNPGKNKIYGKLKWLCICVYLQMCNGLIKLHPSFGQFAI